MMVIVLFRSRLREPQDPRYGPMAERMLQLAEAMPGFRCFRSFRADDGERLSLIEFETEEQLAAWRDHPEHREAQRLGREAFYAEYRVQVVYPLREGRFALPATG